RTYARFLLGFLAFLFWSAVAPTALGGIFVIQMYMNYRYLFQESFLFLPGWLAVAVALILLLTGVLAIRVAVKGSRYWQGALMYSLLLLLCLQMSLAVLVQFYTTQMPSKMKSTMGYIIYQYKGPHSQDPGSRAVDVLQRELQCCGVENYTDWLKAKAASWHLPAEDACVPESCCKEKCSQCRLDLSHLEQLFQEGCLKKLEDQLRFVMLYVFWCCTGLSVLELLAGVGNGILMRHQPFCDLRIL
ncbi:TSN3 protein, partial [Rhynochetos jubatus]|nr:TSN3 protein [Rhynochetos jubatus]